MAQATGPSSLVITQNLDAIDHEGEILAVDYEPVRRVLMSSGSDNRIKIWSLRKVLLFEIKLDEGLKYTIWSNDLEILVLHRNKLLYLRRMQLQLDEGGQQEEEGEGRKFVQLDLKEKFQQVRSETSKRKVEREAPSELPLPPPPRRKALSQADSKLTDPLPRKKEEGRLSAQRARSKREGGVGALGRWRAGE
jgi:hypothetical protein